jgi:hypothetical protein
MSTEADTDTDNDAVLTRGYTVADLALRWRMGADKIRGLIRRGELPAINTSSVRCGKPRFVVLPEVAHDYEQTLAVSTPPPKPTPRRKRTEQLVDYFADV